MSKSSGPLPLKTLRLKPLREEEMVSPVGSSTGGVQKLQRPGTLPPLSRRKTNRGLREDIMKRKRKEKPVLQVLLIAALALNTTLSFVVLANRNRMEQATEKKDSSPAPAVITLEGATVDGKPHAAANPASRPDAGASPKRNH